MKNSAGKVIVYTITEDTVSGYTTSIVKGDDGYSFTVTNTRRGGGGGGIIGLIMLLCYALYLKRRAK